MRVQSLNSLTARLPPIAVQFLNVSSPCSRIGMRAIALNLVPRSRLTFCPELVRRLLQTIGADSTGNNVARTVPLARRTNREFTT